MMTNDTHDDIRDEKLREAVKALPQEIQPERDLWPGIAARIAPRRRHFWALPIAASVAGLIAIGVIVALIGLSLHQRETHGSFVAQPTTRSQPATVAPALNARARIIAATVRRATRSNPKTQAVLLKNLAIIETSIANIEQAMKANPNYTGLQPLLYQLYRDEAALVTAAQRIQLQTTTGVTAL